MKAGTIGLVKTIKSKRKILTEGIQIVQGCDYNHAFIVINKDGKQWAFEQGSIKGAIWTPLEDYFAWEKAGDVVLAWKELRDFDTEKIDSQLTELAKQLYKDGRWYNVWTIFKMIPRQLLQRIGIDYKFKTRPLKHGFVCSVMVCYMLNKLIPSVFSEWQWYAPDDIYTDNKFTYFVQPKY